MRERVSLHVPLNLIGKPCTSAGKCQAASGIPIGAYVSSARGISSRSSGKYWRNSAGKTKGTCGLWKPAPMKKPLLPSTSLSADANLSAASSRWPSAESRMRWSSSWKSKRLSSFEVFAAQSVYPPQPPGPTPVPVQFVRASGSCDTQEKDPLAPLFCVLPPGATEFGQCGGMHSGE